MKGDHGGIPQHALVMKLVHMLYSALLLQNITLCLGLGPGADTHGPIGPTWTVDTALHFSTQWQLTMFLFPLS